MNFLYCREKNLELLGENEELKSRITIEQPKENLSWQVAGKADSSWQDNKGQVVWKQIWTSEQKEIDSSSDQVIHILILLLSETLFYL